MGRVWRDDDDRRESFEVWMLAVLTLIVVGTSIALARGWFG